MLRNPAYAGRAVFGKTQIVHEQPGLNRIARLQGRTTPRPARTVDRPREEWTEIGVPAIVDEDTFARVQQRLADNKKFATRGSKVPSLARTSDPVTRQRTQIEQALTKAGASITAMVEAFSEQHPSPAK
jgi:hypothetical protein